MREIDMNAPSYEALMLHRDKAFLNRKNGALFVGKNRLTRAKVLLPTINSRLQLALTTQTEHISRYLPHHGSRTI